MKKYDFGPQILLDKSALQALSIDEIKALEKHYSITVPPVLIDEIVADLEKVSKDNKPEGTVASLANKIPYGCSYINVHFYSISCGNMLGKKVPMDGRAIIAEGKDFCGAAKSPLLEDLNKWSQQIFSKEDKAFADSHRKKLSELDLELIHKGLKEETLLTFNNCSFASFSQFCKVVEPQVFVSKIRCRFFRTWKAAEEYYANSLRQLARYLGMPIEDHEIVEDDMGAAIDTKPQSGAV
jgi:hypothetical protein